MPVKTFNNEYPVIDTDPHFFRVVRYFRNSDYAAWAAGTAAAPGLLLAMAKRYDTKQYDYDRLTDIIPIEKANPAGPARNLRLPLRLATIVGAFGGFLYAYQNSSLRFWGWTENAQEVAKDQQEMQQRLKEGKSLYGDSLMPEHVQNESSRNSRFAQLKFSAIPWFNLANHNNHGVDTSKYESS